MRRSEVAFALMLLTACDGVQVGNRSQRSGDVKVTSVSLDENASAAPDGVGAPTAWRVKDASAFYGAANEPPVFALQCDRRAQHIVFERAGGGTTLVLGAGGYEVALGTRQLASGRVQARAGLGDALLDRMMRAQSQISVRGGPESFTVPGGVAVRRVVEACRRPDAPPPPVATPEPAPLVVPETIDEPAVDPPVVR